MINPEKQYEHTLYISGTFQNIYESRILKLKEIKDEKNDVNFINLHLNGQFLEADMILIGHPFWAA